MSTKVVLFDIDGVIVPEGEMFFNERLAHEYNIPLELTNAFFKHDFIECLEGRKDISLTLAAYLQSWGWQGSIEELLEYWFSREKATDDRLLHVVEYLRLQKGIKCFIASNQVKQRAEYLLQIVGLKNMFDGAFFSCSVGFMKDKKAFFEYVKSQLPCVAYEEMLFWDDGPVYVDTARSLGIESYVYDTFPEFRKFVEERFNYSST